MILAAGRGERMRPLTDMCPKPMLPVRGKPLIRWHIEALARQANQRLVVNTAWLGSLIEQGLQDIDELKVSIFYSREGLAGTHSQETGALETAGGIIRALPLLADTFWLVAGDVFAPEFEFAASAYKAFAASDKLAHIWLVPNPPHHPKGDFGLTKSQLALNLPQDCDQPRWTYSTIGLYKQSFFAESKTHIPAGNPDGVKAALAPLLRDAMDKGWVSAQLYTGPWTDVGTPERLQELNR